LAAKQALERKIAKYKEEINRLVGEAEKVDRIRLRMFRKRLKRTQRKLASLLQHEERLGLKGKGEEKPAAGKTEELSNKLEEAAEKPEA